MLKLLSNYIHLFENVHLGKINSNLNGCIYTAKGTSQSLMRSIALVCPFQTHYTWSCTYSLEITKAFFEQHAWNLWAIMH